MHKIKAVDSYMSINFTVQTVQFIGWEWRLKNCTIQNLKLLAKIDIVVAPITPWFRLRLPSCGPRFESQVLHLRYFQYVIDLWCEKDKNKRKRGRDWPIFKKRIDIFDIEMSRKMLVEGRKARKETVPKSNFIKLTSIIVPFYSSIDRQETFELTPTPVLENPEHQGSIL